MPAVLGEATSHYGLAVAPDGAIWFTSPSANALVRYAHDRGGRAAYTFFPLPLDATVPYGLAFDATGTLWFTMQGAYAAYDYIGALSVPYHA